jgi:hypothetical protein
MAVESRRREGRRGSACRHEVCRDEGNNWKFLRLAGDTGYVDLAEYHIKEVGRVVGIITSMLKGVASV